MPVSLYCVEIITHTPWSGSRYVITFIFNYYLAWCHSTHSYLEYSSRPWLKNRILHFKKIVYKVRIVTESNQFCVVRVHMSMSCFELEKFFRWHLKTQNLLKLFYWSRRCQLSPLFSLSTWVEVKLSYTYSNFRRHFV